MCEHLKHSTGIRKLSEVQNAMVYYQGCERQNLPDNKLLRRDSFSSEELSLSRNSSFSSCSSSATGSSGYGCTLDTDSSVSRSSVRLSGISPRLDSPLKHAVTKPEDHCSRQPSRSKHRLERNSALPRDNRLLDRNHCQPNTKPKKDQRSFRFPERSISETELLLSRSGHLCSPEGLIISTPRAKGTHLSANEKRVRSKSESYDEKSSPNIEGSKEKSKDSTKSKRSVPAKRRETTAVDCCIDESAMKRCLVLLEASCEGKKGHKLKDAAKRIAALESQVEQVCQERDSALRERNEMMHDRDRIKCERDALELERDNLLRDKEIFEKELVNRSNVIDHLKEHLGLAVIPVKLTARNMNCPVSIQVPKETSTTYEHDAPAGRKFKTRPRSKSEIKTPEFYFPDQILKTNAYTCL